MNIRTTDDQKIGILGATGNVGRTMLSLLAQHNVPAAHIIALASHKSAGQKIDYGTKGDSVTVMDVAGYDFSQARYYIFSAGGQISKIYAPKAIEAGGCVIDNTSYFRMDDHVPLIVAEVNAYLIKDHPFSLIANPNCVLAQVAVALKPLHDQVPIKRVMITTYQSVSGAGEKAMKELEDQTRDVLEKKSLTPRFFSQPIAFNVIPQIGPLLANGYSEEEWKIIQELKKVLSPSIAVSAFCVRVPVFVGHSCVLHVEFEAPMDSTTAKKLLENSPGITPTPHDTSPNTHTNPTPKECAHTNGVYVGRIHTDISAPNSLCLWVVADNLRKGAAFNALQILSILKEK
jgi:aspartate-semialdehyde dehydrogenase